MITCVSQFGSHCRRALALGPRLVSCQINSRQISLSSSHSAKPAVNIGGLGKSTGKKLGKLGLAVEKRIVPVETDAQKLHDFVCGSNLLKEGGEDVKIQPDSEYPEWLWNMRTGKFPDLSEMDPESKEYWLKVRRMGIWEKKKQMKFKRFT